MSHRTVGEELRDALDILREALIRLGLADVVLSRARDAAAANGMPTDGLEGLRVEIETLVGFVRDTAIVTLQKMAEDEAGSRG